MRRYFSIRACFHRSGAWIFGGLLFLILAQPAIAQRKQWSSKAQQASNAELVQWLHDDDIRWNAMAAGREITSRIGVPEHRRELLNLLRPYVFDRQPQVSLVAIGMHQRDRREVPYTKALAKEELELDRALLRASVDFLNHYTTCTYPNWIWQSVTYKDCVIFLLEKGPTYRKWLEPMLWQGLRTHDPYGSWIHAFLLASMGWQNFSAAQLSELSAVLMKRLKDNHIHDDALMCMVALFKLGQPIIPYLEKQLLKSTYLQQQAALTMLIFELNAPSAPDLTEAELRALNSFTFKCDFPIREWRFKSHSH